MKEKYKEKQKQNEAKTVLMISKSNLEGKIELKFEYFEVSQYVSESQWTFFYGATFIGHFVIWLDIFFLVKTRTKH